MIHHHRLWLVTVTDPKTFAAYRDLARPVAARYGHIELALTEPTVVGAVEPPTVAHLVRQRAVDSIAAFEADPAFLAVAPLRDRSTRLLHLDGSCPAEGGGLDETAAAGPEGDPADLAGRRYLIEIARLSDPDGYAAYSRKATAAMAPYGYHVGHRFAVTGRSAGWPFPADLVTVAWFDDPDGQARFEQDPVHAELEGDAYDAVVADSIWLVGAATP